MKKIACVILTIAAIFAVAAPEQKAEAQYITYTPYCCDGFGIVRCNINATPVGNPCFCYGQGWGRAC